MKSVRVDRLELIAKATENRARHAEAVKVAREGYRLELQAALVAALQRVSDGQLDGIHKAIRNVTKPADHTRDYDDILAMLEMSQDPLIELTNSEFQQIVRDLWHWRDEWTASNSKYLSSRP